MSAPHRGFWRCFIHGALIVAGAAAITFVLHRYGMFDRWENDNLDRWMLAKTPQLVEDVVLVVIDDADYRNVFKNTSPLAPELVIEVLEAIAKGRPKVIGVDLDTSHWNKDQAERASQITNVVWARDGWVEEGNLKMGNLLGGFSSEMTCFGLAAVQLDDDGVVRRYRRTQQVGDRNVPTFPGLLARARTPQNDCTAEEGVEDETARGKAGVLINFLGRGLTFRRLTSSAVVTLSSTPEWREHSDVNSKIVLLGGVFRAARDRYMTPVGLMDGVTIVAHEVYSELSTAKHLVEADHERHLIADIALGLILVAILYFVPGPWKLLVIPGAFALAVVFSFWLFYTTAYFFSFVPVLAGVMLHEAIESSLERRSLERENQSLERENHKLRAAGGSPSTEPKLP